MEQVFNLCGTPNNPPFPKDIGDRVGEPKS